MSQLGTVKAYDEAHRRGVIHSDNDDADLVVEASDLDASGLDHLTPDCRVDFELADEGNGRARFAKIVQLQDPTIVAGRSMSLERLHNAGFKSIF